MTPEKKTEIVNLIQSKVLDDEILKKFEISKSSLWRIKKGIVSQDQPVPKEEKAPVPEIENEKSSESEIENEKSSESEKKETEEESSEESSVDFKSEKTETESVKSEPPPIKFPPKRQQQPRIETPPPVKFQPPKNQLNEDEKNKHQTLVLQIRNYIQCFPELKKIYIDKERFCKSLFSKRNEELEVILESFRVELSVGQHLETFMNIFYFIVSSVEKGSSFLGIDMNGLLNDVRSDPLFEQNIKMLSCEIPLNLTPKQKIMFLLGRACLLRYNMNVAKAGQKEVQLRDPEPKKIDALREKFKDI